MLFKSFIIDFQKDPNGFIVETDEFVLHRFVAVNKLVYYLITPLSSQCDIML